MLRISVIITCKEKSYLTLQPHFAEANHLRVVASCSAGNCTITSVTPDILMCYSAMSQVPHVTNNQLPGMPHNSWPGVYLQYTFHELWHSLCFVGFTNYANPVYGFATICHQVHWLRWGHRSFFHTAMSLLIWYKMFCVRDISNRLIWMEFINMFSVYAQSGMHSHFKWWIIVVLTYNPSFLMCVEITNAPKL